MNTKNQKTKKTIYAFFAMLAVITSLIPMAPTTHAALAPGGAVGPVNPATGFPNWYMDQNGLALELIEAADSMGISAPVEPGNLFSEQIGFGAEGFWWAADAAITNASIDALLVQAMEAAFAGESAVNGEQSSFGRVRFTIDVPAVGTYVIRYPFGTETFVVDALTLGPEIKNAGADIGCFATAGVLSCDPNNPQGNPNNFGIALQSGIGPFLTWDTFNLNQALTDPLLANPALPNKRYVGNPTIEHAIKGSPAGQNFFRIDGPEGVDLNPALPGIQTVIQTDLFTVVGRLAVIDTIVPAVVSAPPALVTVGSTNVIASIGVTDDIGARSATIDLGAFGNTLTATLNGAHEVPASPSPATGSGTFTIDTTANTLSFNITTSGLTGGTETGAHIHGPATAGVDAPVLFALPLGASKVGVWNYPETLEGDILNGQTYVNVHTLLFPDGEIRGQITPASDIRNMILTAGTNTNGTWGVVIPNVDRLGTFELPITVTDGSNITSGVVMTLNVIPVLNSAAVTPATSTVFVGSTQQLSVAGFDPSGAPITSGLTTTWSSSDPLVVTVDANGLITGVVAGSAIITASMTNGVNTVAGTSSITVRPVPVLTSVTVAPLSANIIIGATQQITASILDQNGAGFADSQISWTSTNPLVATVDANGLITGVVAGSAIITATAVSGAVTASGTSTINVTACQTTADTDLNGTISNLEILNYVRNWKGGLVSNLLMLRAIGFWKTGAGC